MSDNTIPLYCRVSEAARLLGMPKRTLYAAVKAGAVPGARIVGGAILVPMAWVLGEDKAA